MKVDLAKARSTKVKRNGAKTPRNYLAHYAARARSALSKQARGSKWIDLVARHNSPPERCCGTIKRRCLSAKIAASVGTRDLQQHRWEAPRQRGGASLIQVRRLSATSRLVVTDSADYETFPLCRCWGSWPSSQDRQSPRMEVLPDECYGSMNLRLTNPHERGKRSARLNGEGSHHVGPFHTANCRATD